jgi:uncharacterized protein YgbK (DUF1537 family)
MRVAVLDDDPTGTQAASDVTVLLRWSADDVTRVLRDEGAVYLQTNSRAVPEPEAVALATRIREQLDAASAALGERVLPVLRGDSTLRGHVAAESAVFAGDQGRVLFVPAFPAGGRTTVDGVHRVRIDGVDVPAGETEFARDPVFGYRSSRLVDWVRERAAADAVPVPLAALRASGGAAVAEALASAAPGAWIVPDAIDDDDIRLIHTGLLAALSRDVPVVVRCAATLAALCAGRPSAAPLARPVPVGGGPLLVVCGSHTAAASDQLAALAAATGVDPVVVPTDDALADPEAAGERVASRARPLRDAGLAIIATERSRRPEHDRLDHGELVMRALMTAARALAPGAGAVVSKGGITSAEVARVALGADAARVRGQLAAGISVWDLPDGAVQVVVPGNVGGADALVDVIAALGRGGERP